MDKPGTMVRITSRVVVDHGDGHGSLVASRGAVMTTQHARALRIPASVLEPYQGEPIATPTDVNLRRRRPGIRGPVATIDPAPRTAQA